MKGTQFNNWRTVGSVPQAINLHGARGADEIMLLDTKASLEGRLISKELVGRVSSQLRVPLAVGGGIRTVDDVRLLLSSGADKVVLGTTAATNLDFVAKLSEVYGSQAIVCAVDCVDEDHTSVGLFSGTKRLEIAPHELAIMLEAAGAGELLVQNISHDGMMVGLDWELMDKVSSCVAVPIIGGSGASTMADFEKAISLGLSAVSVGSLFQFTEVTPSSVRDWLRTRGHSVRN